MRSIHDEMLYKLYADINRRAAEIATADPGNPKDQYLTLYRYIEDSVAIIWDGFNDWGRSKLSAKILSHVTTSRKSFKII